MKKLLLTLVALFPSTVFAATSIPFTVNMNEAVTVTGTPRVAVDVGGVTRYATYTSGSGTNAMTFTLSPQAGDVDLDGITVSSPVDLNGGTLKDNAGNNAALTFTPPNTSGIKVNYPSLGMDFVYDADGRYSLNGTVYNDLTSFLSAAGGSFTRSSVGTYFDSTGTLQTAASGVPRFDWDPVTHAAKGILIEESRTNLIYPSDVAPPNYNCTQLLNAMLAPDGTMTGSACTATAAGSVSYAAHLYSTFVAGTTYTYSIFVKKAGPQYVRLSSNSASIYNINAVFDLQAGALLSGAGSIRSVGNGWYRLIATGSSSTSGAQRVLVIPTDSAGQNRVATSVGEVQLYSWGAQLEAGALPTSYIPTTTAAVTRAADVLSIPTGGWFNGASGSLFVKGKIPYLGWNNTPRMASISDLSANNLIDLYVNDAASDQNRAIIYNGGSQSYLASLGTYTAGTLFKGVLAYSAASSNSSINALLGTSSAASIPTVTNLYAGNRYDGNRGLNGWLENLKYYPSRITDSQLQLLTQ